jgi:transcriptional regulator with XRE-family HTH domain
LGNERASRLFFFFCGSFWRHGDVELSRHDGEILLAKERAAAAFDSGIDRSYLGGIEREAKNPTVDLLDRLAGTLGVPMADLFAEAGRGERKPDGLKRGRRKIRST